MIPDIFHFFIYISKIFYLCVCFVSFSSFVYSCLSEFYNQTYFKTELNQYKSKTTFWETTPPSSNYRPIYFVTDIFIVIRNFKKHIHYLPNFILFFFLFSIFFFVPALYALLFQFYFVKRILILIYWYFFNLTRVMSNPDFEFSKKNKSMFNFFRLLIKLPDFWAFFVVYTYFFTKKKIKFKDLEKIGFNLLFTKPFWFFKLVGFLSNTVFSVFESKIFKRKIFWLWPKIFFEEVLTDLNQFINENQSKTFPLIANRKIFISNRKISLNPMSQEFFNFLRKEGATGINSYSYGKIIYTKNIPHQMFTKGNKTDNGFIMTTSAKVRLNNNFMSTTNISSDDTTQRLFFSAHTLDIIESKFRYFRTFFKQRANNFNDYFMLQMRLNLISKIETSENLIIQQKKNHIIIPLNKNLTYSQIYTETPFNQDLIDHHVAYIKTLENDAIRLTTLKTELKDMTDAELYNNYTSALSSASFYTQIYASKEKQDLKNSFNSITF